MFNLCLRAVIFVDVFDQIVEQAFSFEFAVYLLEAGLVEEDEIVVGQPIPLDPQATLELKDHFFVVDGHYVL